MTTSILVVEDEPAIQELLRLNLEANDRSTLERAKARVVAAIGGA